MLAFSALLAKGYTSHPFQSYSKKTYKVVSERRSPHTLTATEPVCDNRFRKRSTTLKPIFK